jgi:endo-1,4-beta-xylanase
MRTLVPIRKMKTKGENFRNSSTALLWVITVVVCITFVGVAPMVAGVQDTIQTNVPALKNVFARDFFVGCLLSYRVIGFSTDPYVPGQSAVVDTLGGYLVKYHMNSMGPGNNMKPQYTVDLASSLSAYNAAGTQAAKDSINIHPIVRFNGDLIAQLNWAQRQGFKMRGHTLVWHNQTPGTGFFRTGYSATGGRVSKDTMTLRLENYIKEVIRLLHQGWPGLLLAMDVVNEAVNDGTGTDRTAGNEWYTTFGDISYIAKAFEFTRKYTVQYGETQIKLYYNDYNTHDANKANGIVRICGPIFHAGNLDGIGMQEHDGASSPTPAQWKASYAKFDTVCSEMAVTEFDVTTSPYTPAGLAAQARQVGALMKCFVEKSFRSGRGKIVNFTKDGLNDLYTFNINSSFWDSTDQCKPSFHAAAAVGIHYNALDSLIAAADTLQGARFTPESWAAMTAALNFAKGAMARDYSASVSAADTLAQADVALRTALNGLVLGIGGSAGETAPRFFALDQNYPNPFNPKTVVSYQLSVVSDVRLMVYDMLGREVTVLVNERQPAGSYKVSFDAGGLASGAYVYRMVAGSFVDSKTMLLVK